ncbi:MAG: hypothetical protein IT161_02515 [Bryobacterales bacterium]|nr:hypothetical protein [Bryobacterales bacterium]
MHPHVRTALSLQSVDLQIGELQREIATLPKQIAEIEKLLASHVAKLELDKAASEANKRDRKNLEAEIQQQNQKISKLRDQMGGSKITNDQYRAFQHEIEFCEKAIRKAEDRILDLMGEFEPLEKAVKAAEGALAAEKKVVDGEKSKARARSNEDKAQVARFTAGRKELAAALPKELLNKYERMRVKLKDGLVVVDAAGGLCAGCRLTLRPQYFEEVKKGEEVHQCENCHRILYYEEAQSFEDLVDQSAAEK